ncbi:MAG: ShlB/FhaC/HecB family hemolysin secretion/activation protein [Nitrospira sp.]|nr:MAG: ShlB/FhaC/HecB family hemolysin secretion/activation protein [Nitrospira sp.]
MFTWIVIVMLSGAVMGEALALPSVSFGGESRQRASSSAPGIRMAQAVGGAVSRESIAATQSSSSEVSQPAQGQEPKIQPESSGFAVDQYLVEGNSLLPTEKVDAILAKYKRKGLILKDIEQAKNELEKAYRDAGYPTVLVTIPEQTIEGGTVRLLVVEGRIGSIAVTGNQYFRQYEILDKLPSLSQGNVLYEPTFMKELNLLNVHPDRKVVPVLKPGESKGLISLELKVKDRLPVHGKIEGDNRGAISTPANRLVAELQHTNLLGGDEIFTVSTVQTPTDWGQVQSYSASFVVPIVWPDHLLSLYGSQSASKSVLAGGSAFVGGGNISVSGNATVSGFRYFMPIAKDLPGTHSLSLGMDYKHLKATEATFPGNLGTATVLGPIQYTPASVNYTGTYYDAWGYTRLTATAKGYVAGMIPGGSKEDFSGDPSNPFAPPGQRRGSTGTFAVLQGGLDRIQSLPGDFMLALHADGQWGSQPLIPAEQYFAGGFDTVRGYGQFESLGDNAVRGRAELTTPELIEIPIDRMWQRRRSADYTIRVKFAAFYDAAQLWVQQAQLGQTSKFRLEGVGAGIRVKFPKDVGQLIIDQGFALRDTALTQQGDTFVHFSVGLAF